MADLAHAVNIKSRSTWQHRQQERVLQRVTVIKTGSSGCTPTAFLHTEGKSTSKNGPETNDPHTVPVTDDWDTYYVDIQHMRTKRCGVVLLVHSKYLYGRFAGGMTGQGFAHGDLRLVDMAEQSTSAGLVYMEPTI